MPSAANVPIIVAVNKMDKPGASNPTVILQQLTEYELVPEEWGGDAIVCNPFRLIVRPWISTTCSKWCFLTADIA